SFERNGAGDEAGTGQPADSAERQYSDFEASDAGIGWTARDFRSASAAIHSRHSAQSQGAVAASGVSGGGARRSSRDELSGAAGAGIERQAACRGEQYGAP